MQLNQFQAIIKSAMPDHESLTAEIGNRWSEAMLAALDVFGADVFIPGAIRSVRQSDGTVINVTQYDALREAVVDCFPVPAAPDRADKSEAANKIREQRKHASTRVSTCMSRMAKYYAQFAGATPEAKPDIQLSKLVAGLLTRYHETDPDKGRVIGKMSAGILAGLKQIAGDDWKPVKVTTGKKAITKAKRAGKVEVTKPAPISNDDMAQAMAGIVATRSAPMLQAA